MLVAILVELGLALAFALVARDRIRADGPSAPPAFLLVAAHAAVVTLPVAFYFYAVQPAWTWHYLIDPAKVPALAILPLVVATAWSWSADGTWARTWSGPSVGGCTSTSWARSAWRSWSRSRSCSRA
jgi:hypothetical protein